MILTVPVVNLCLEQLAQTINKSIAYGYQELHPIKSENFLDFGHKRHERMVLMNVCSNYSALSLTRIRGIDFSVGIRNVLWVLNLVRRITDPSMIDCWGLSRSNVIQGHLGSNTLRNMLLLLNLSIRVIDYYSRTSL